MKDGDALKIIAIGDVVGDNGCEFLMRHLPSVKKLYGAELCIINGENSAQGNGITPHSAERLFACGADVITTGNHVYRRREFYDYLDEDNAVVRPANFPSSCPGRGMYIADMGRLRVAVINLMGTVYMEPLKNPFECAEELVKKAESEGCKIIILDFHAEATAEKRAMGFFLDGRVSAVFGTHTHVPTADEQILPGGTAYITDLGMTGPKQSVLGVTPNLAIEKMRTNMPVRFENPDGECVMQGCVFEIDEKSGRAVSVRRIAVE